MYTRMAIFQHSSKKLPVKSILCRYFIYENIKIQENDINIDRKLKEIEKQMDDLKSLSLDLGFEDGGFDEKDIVILDDNDNDRIV